MHSGIGRIMLSVDLVAIFNRSSKYVLPERCMMESTLGLEREPSSRVFDLISNKYKNDKKPWIVVSSGAPILFSIDWVTSVFTNVEESSMRRESMFKVNNYFFRIFIAIKKKCFFQPLGCVTSI